MHPAWIYKKIGRSIRISMANKVCKTVPQPTGVAPRVGEWETRPRVHGARRRGESRPGPAQGGTCDPHQNQGHQATSHQLGNLINRS